jgi:hypothetical protein
MPSFHQAMERLADDSTFRASILENTDLALRDYEVTPAQRETILQQVEMIEAEVQTDPLESTTADTGQTDGAAKKH